MLFIEINSPECGIYRAIRAPKICGVNLEGCTVTIYVDDSSMPQTTLTFDTPSQAKEQYDKILEDMKNTLI